MCIRDRDYVDRNLVRASTTKMAQSRRKQLEKLEIPEAPKDETNQLKFRFESVSYTHLDVYKRQR